MLLIMRREDVHTSSRHVHRVWCLASCIAGLTLWHGVFVEVVLVMCTDAVRFCVIKMFMLVPPHTFFFFQLHYVSLGRHSSISQLLLGLFPHLLANSLPRPLFP